MNLSSVIPEVNNARSLSLAEVVETFVANSHFASVCKPNHTLIVGPRGSGKTTLLKMLQPWAVQNWKSPKSIDLPSSVNFIGVFIAADRSWRTPGKPHSEEKLSKLQLVAKAIFVSHVLRSVIESMEQLVQLDQELHQRFLKRDDDVLKFFKLVYKAWELDPGGSSLSAVKESLYLRLSTLGQLRAKIVSMPDKDIDDCLSRGVDFIYMQWIEAVLPIISAFDRIRDQEGRKWAFMFDEVELVPRHISESLYNSFRSVDSKILIKLALAPQTFANISGTRKVPAQEKDDYELVHLWFSNKADQLEFSKALWIRLFSSWSDSNIGRSNDPVEMLGSSVFDSEDTAVHESGIGYGKGSKNYKRFLSLSEKDPSFREYLTRHGIDVENMNLVPAARRPQLLRKVAPIVIVRDEYLGFDKRTNKLKGRSRKQVGVYAGERSIFAIAEGNPRWLIGLAQEMRKSNTSKRQVAISPERQVKAVEYLSGIFLRRLQIMDSVEEGEARESVYDLVDKLGSFLRDSLLGPQFNPEYLGCFEIKGDLLPEHTQILWEGLNSGAFVPLSSIDPESVGNFKAGFGFRLSYLIAPKYKLLLSVGRKVRFAKALSNARKSLLQEELISDE